MSLIAPLENVLSRSLLDPLIHTGLIAIVIMLVPTYLLGAYLTESIQNAISMVKRG